MTTIYEGMYLIDNAAVREDWNAAKSIVTGTLEKHGATVHTARRWDERRLAYPIKRRNRATFLLTYFEMPGENIPAMRRDFEFTESVLRSLEIARDAVPEEERELSAAEQSAEFSVPPPPEDDAIDETETAASEDYDEDDDRGERPRRRRRDSGESGAEDGGKPPSRTTRAKDTEEEATKQDADQEVTKKDAGEEATKQDADEEATKEGAGASKED